MDAPASPPAPRPESLIAGVFTLAAALVGLSGRLPDDEGVLTFIGATVVAREPLAGLFFQKIHPATSALYAPFAALGWRPFVVAHAVAAGLAIHLLGGVARRVGRGPPWLPALILATSPLYLLSAATGQSNSTAILFFVGALALLDGSPRAQALAGVVAAAGLWSRYEQAPYLLALVAFDGLHRRRPYATAGFAGAVTLYLLAGALYHRDALWIVARPPVMPREVGPSTMGALGLTRADLASLLTGFFLLTPAAFVPLLLRPRAAAPLLRGLAATLALAFAAQLALPQLGRLFNYDYTARYFLCHLPALALLIGEVAADTAPSGRRAFALGALALGAGFALHEVSRPYAAAAAALLALPWIVHTPRGRVVSLAVAACAGLVAAPLVGERHTAAPLLPGLAVAAAEVERAPRGSVVYTNAHQLQRLLDARGSGRRVRVLVGHDMVNELATELGGRQSAQSAAVFRALEPVLYGEVLWPCAFPHTAPAGSLLVLAMPERAAWVYDLRAWTEASNRVRASGVVAVWRARAAVTIPRAAPPPWMSPAAFALPCAERRAPPGAPP
jgi:hypothetical protein